MKFDNQLRRSLEQIILKMHDEYENADKWLDWGLLEILDYVEADWNLQGRDDHEELAFCLFRYFWGAGPRYLSQYKVEDLGKYMIDAKSAIVDLYMAAYHLDDDINSTKAEGRREILSVGDKERLQEIAVKIIGHPDGVFEGPGEDPYNFTSALEEFWRIHPYNGDPRAPYPLPNPSHRTKTCLRVMRIFIEVDKKENQASHRYWGQVGELENYVDDSDREIRERVRELLGILQTLPFSNTRAKPIEEAFARRYYTDGERTDVDENGDLIDWAKSEPGLYDEKVEEEGEGFEGLRDLFG